MIKDDEGRWVLPLVQRQVLALLRHALNSEPTGELDPCLAVCKVDWAKVYAEAERQSVVGLCWGGIEKLPKEKLPPMDWLMEWLGQAEYIKEQNWEVNKAIASVVSLFREKGYEGVVLKGQGLAQLYPQPELRTSGDIDYLVGDCMPSDEYIRKVAALAKGNNGEDALVTYHHCDFGKVQDIEVELHWRASWFYCPWYNRRFQKFCNEHIDDSKNWRIVKSGSDPDLKEMLEIPTPSLAFNRVYVLVHLYRHLFSEGIGFRQVIDYFMVLKASAQSAFWSQEKIESMQRLMELGLERFTAAVMWVISNLNADVDDNLLLCEPNEKDGMFLMDEIMTAGNFGHGDKRTLRRKGESFIRFKLRRIVRTFRLFRFGRMEVICTPFWRLWHLYWWMPRHR